MTKELLYELLHDIWKISSHSDFSGIGVIICNDTKNLSITNLRDTNPIQNGSTIDLLSDISSKENKYHDGFHILDELGNITHIAQYFSPQVIPNIWFDRSRFVGGRFVAALYGSFIEEIKFTGIVSEGGRLSIFENGKETHYEELQ
ncbi:diadenylate cyclase [Pectobacterium carotovorum]|uniref:diadenylate cyclase n=1 Tax=Pectobacterium carotovorum TaxID=554 RepID=UPI001CF35FD1|nr:diadenylate cyclase [Pectobacterium carotovorum]MCA6969766.1 diadenylate cyclase [Pectobacterium carotovorum]MCH4996795.1 DNA integrity scanning protein DisA nucleotide-binding domain protein [Pectobacterium carotovorum]